MSPPPVRPVVILDQVDNTLHFAGDTHLSTKCGLQVDEASVGPLSALVGRAAQMCTACFEVVDSATRPGQHQFWERS
jgi:hypothetical protein